MFSTFHRRFLQNVLVMVVSFFVLNLLIESLTLLLGPINFPINFPIHFPVNFPINFYGTFHINFPIRVKSVTRYLHMLLLSMCEFHEIWRKEGRSFFIRTNEILFTSVPRN